MEKNYKNESMVDVAHDILCETNVEMPFADLFNQVAEKLELSEEEKSEKISSFYTDISLDGRFVYLKGNFRGLRVNNTYDKVHIDINDVYAEMSAESIGNRDAEEYDSDEEDQNGNTNEDNDDDDSYVDGSQN